MAFFDSSLRVGAFLAAIIGIIALLVVFFMREDGDRSKCDPILDNPGRRPQTREEGAPDAFHPVLPTPTPLPNSFLN